MEDSSFYAPTKCPSCLSENITLIPMAHNEESISNCNERRGDLELLRSNHLY
jgi:hypothetical protein